MLENEMEINKLEEEKLELQKQVKELIEQNKQLIEELNYSRCNNNRSNIHTNSINTDRTHIHNLDVSTVYNDLRMATDEEAEQLVNAYAEAMNIDFISKGEVI